MQQQPCAVFWDIENMPVSNGVRTYDLVSNLKTVLARLHIAKTGQALQVLDIYAIGNLKIISDSTRKELQDCGVLTLDVASGKPSAADMSIMVEVMKFTHKQPPPAWIILISSDGDFSKAMHYLDSIGYTVVCFHGKFSSQGLRSGPFLAVPFQSLLESALPLASSKPASTRPPSKATSANLLVEVKGNLYQPTAKSSLPQDLKANLVSSKSGRRRTKSATEPVDIPVKGSSNKSQKDVTGSYGSGGARSGISTGASRTNSLVIKPSNSSLKPEKVLTKKNAENEGSRKSLSDSEERRPKNTASPKKKKNKEDTKQVKEQSSSSSRSADRRSEFFVSGIEDTCLSTDSESDYCRS